MSSSWLSTCTPLTCSCDILHGHWIRRSVHYNSTSDKCWCKIVKNLCTDLQLQYRPQPLVRLAAITRSKERDEIESLACKLEKTHNYSACSDFKVRVVNYFYCTELINYCKEGGSTLSEQIYEASMHRYAL